MDPKEHAFVTSEDIARLDDNANSLGIPKILLMECAGLQAANEIYTRYSLTSSSVVLIFCGLGNNGGDGFVLARHLASRGISIYLALIGDPDKIQTEISRTNWQIIQNLSLNIQIFILRDSTDVSRFVTQPFFIRCDLIVDAILGTGVAGKLREPIATAIDVINSAQCPKVSLDVPSGTDPNTGSILDKSVRCDFLISFHRQKSGFQSMDSSKTTVVSIGLPLEAHLFVGEGDLRSAIVPRKKTNHKGNYGKLLVIGGSAAYSGAPTLAALTGLEFGLDLVIALVPQSISPIVRQFSPNLIVRSGQQENFSPLDLPLAKELSQWADAIVIGPGLGLAAETQDFLREYFLWVASLEKPVVIDADAIKIAGQMKQKGQFSHPTDLWIFTPHVEELKGLISTKNLPAYDLCLPRAEFLYRCLHPLKSIYLVKGVYDYIIDCNAPFPLGVRINRTGCSEMSVGGTGDVLAGLVGGFCALKIPSHIAAAGAAYLNGKLGEVAVKQQGSRIHATDLIHSLRPYMQKLFNGTLLE